MWMMRAREQARVAKATAKNLPFEFRGASTPFEIGSPYLPSEGMKIPLFDADNLKAAYQRTVTFGVADKRDRDMAIKSIRRVGERGLKRVVRVPPAVDHVANWLRLKHPNFSEVIDLVEAELMLAGSANKPPRLPPMLLDGPPGCGKTFFAEKLAEAFGSGFLRVSLESAQNASDLSGSSEFWGNSRPGRLFDKLVEGDHANPVVLVDEVDKAGGREDYRADRSLYQLLDRGTARVWSDLAYPTLTIDTSYVVWILTSNNLTRIEPSLLSRMHIFHIQPLGHQEARDMVRQIFADVVGELDLPAFDRDLAIGYADMLRPYSLREVSRLARALIASAVQDGRNQVDARDFEKTGACNAALAKIEPFLRKSFFKVRQ